MRKTKQVVFGADDEDILFHLRTSDCKFSTYVKKLIRQDMYAANNNPTEALESRLEELINLVSNGAAVAPTVHVEPKTETVATEAQKQIIKGVLGKFASQGK